MCRSLNLVPEPFSKNFFWNPTARYLCSQMPKVTGGSPWCPTNLIPCWSRSTSCRPNIFRMPRKERPLGECPFCMQVITSCSYFAASFELMNLFFLFQESDWFSQLSFSRDQVNSARLCGTIPSFLSCLRGLLLLLSGCSQVQKFVWSTMRILHSTKDCVGCVWQFSTRQQPALLSCRGVNRPEALCVQHLQNARKQQTLLLSSQTLQVSLCG